MSHGVNAQVSRWDGFRRRVVAGVAVGIVIAGFVTEPAAAADKFTVKAFPWETGHVFDVSRFGNPLNDAGQVAGQVWERGHFVAAIFDTRTGTAQSLDTANRDSTAYDVNRRGQVVGNIWGNGTIHPFVWSAGHPMLRDLEPGAAPGASFSANAINDRGVVVGARWEDGSRSARLWRLRHGRVHAVDLGARLHLQGSTAVGISNRGAVLINYFRGTPNNGALVWSPRWGVRNIEPLPGDDVVVASAMSSRGLVAGVSYRSSEPTHLPQPFVWSPRTRTARALSIPVGNYVEPSAVGSTGLVVGRTIEESGLFRGVVWDVDGKSMTVLPGQTATSGSDSVAVGVDSHDRIVGADAAALLWWTPRPKT